ncbi:uncharacterized protein [Takifugu rubripes]|uniref:uncharacterized protein n=1 Tax=Takifugu rubripes TaxID=31033 RepID=UPI00114584B6|nr:uncharacterized protein LOC105419122 [Takifugu rubripes]
MQYVVQQPHGGIFPYLPAQPFPNNMEYFLTGANPSLYPRTAPNTYNLQTLVQPIETGHQKVIEDPFNDLNEMLSLLSTLKDQAQPYFKKDHPELLPEVKRKVRQRTRSRTAPYSNPYNVTRMQYVVQQPHGGIFPYLPAQPFPNNMEYFLTGANPSLYPRTAPNTYNLQTLVQPIETGHQKVIEDPFNDLNEMLSLLSTLKEQAQWETSGIPTQEFHPAAGVLPNHNNVYFGFPPMQ